MNNKRRISQNASPIKTDTKMNDFEILVQFFFFSDNNFFFATKKKFRSIFWFRKKLKSHSWEVFVLKRKCSALKKTWHLALKKNLTLNTEKTLTFITEHYKPFLSSRCSSYLKILAVEVAIGTKMLSISSTKVKILAWLWEEWIV